MLLHVLVHQVAQAVYQAVAILTYVQYESGQRMSNLAEVMSSLAVGRRRRLMAGTQGTPSVDFTDSGTTSLVLQLAQQLTQQPATDAQLQDAAAAADDISAANANSASAAAIAAVASIAQACQATGDLQQLVKTSIVAQTYVSNNLNSYVAGTITGRELQTLVSEQVSS